MDIHDVQMPGYAAYDDGATGVTVTFHGKRWFVLSDDEDDFWSSFPHSIFKGCFHSANGDLSRPAGR